MNRLHWWVVAAWAAIVPFVTRAEALPPPATTSPDGPYHVLRLELSEGLHDNEKGQPTGPQQLLVTLRDGKLAQAWFVRPFDGDKRLMVERSTVQLKGTTIAGEIWFRTAPGRQRPQVDVVLKIDWKTSGDKLTGSYEIVAEGSPYRSAKGTASGVVSAAARPEDALRSDSSWASFDGTHGNGSTTAQPQLIADLAKARPVWRSETYVPTAYGNAPDSRYFTRAIVSGNGGGASSPVVVDGVVYIHYHTPSLDSPPALKGNPFWERSYPTEEAFREQMAKLNANEREQALVLNHFRPLADDHIVALDGATGEVKWHTVLPGRSPNLQTHKHRGLSGVPLVVGDTLYVTNLAGRVYALATKSGHVRWEQPGLSTPTQTPTVRPALTPSPRMIGDTLIVVQGAFHDGTTLGLDPATGDEKWTAPGGYVMRWSKEGQERLIVIGGHDKRQLSCISAADGKLLWKQDTTLAATTPACAVVTGDLLIAAPPPDRGGPPEVRYEGWKLSDTGAERVWRDEVVSFDENIGITVREGRAYLLGRKLVRMLEVASGRRIAEKMPEQGAPGSNAWLGVVVDRLLLSPEGQHGMLTLRFLDLELNDLGPPWMPPNVSTTAYGQQPINYPIVDGRLFVRGGDGIYCYDLRLKD